MGDIPPIEGVMGDIPPVFIGNLLKILDILLEFCENSRYCPNSVENSVKILDISPILLKILLKF